jgi:hypothetical protein
MFIKRGRCILDRIASQNEAEAEVLRLFRSYRVGVSEMLFFNHGAGKARPQRFTRAIEALIERGMVIRERHRDAYSLTQTGYNASLSV